MSIVSFRERLLDFSSWWIVFIHVVQRHPSSLLQFSKGQTVKIFLASVSSGATWAEQKRSAWTIAERCGCLVVCLPLLSSIAQIILTKAHSPESRHAYQVNKNFNCWKISHEIEHLLNINHRLSTSAVSIDLAILLNLLHPPINTTVISATGNQQFFLHRIIISVTKKIQQTEFQVFEANFSRKLLIGKQDKWNWINYKTDACNILNNQSKCITICYNTKYHSGRLQKAPCGPGGIVE